MERDLKKVREFGELMALVFTILSGIAFIKLRTSSLVYSGIAAVFLGLGYFAPKALAPIEAAWMKFSEVLSTVMTTVIVTLVFYLGVTPLGLLMRLMGKDPLRLKLDRTAKSYWINVEPDGPGSRPNDPY